jgi:hypothetical protein
MKGCVDLFMEVANRGDRTSCTKIKEWRGYGKSHGEGFTGVRYEKGLRAGVTGMGYGKGLRVGKGNGRRG